MENQSPECCRAIYQKLDCFMKKTADDIRDGQVKFCYNLQTHRYLMDYGWPIKLALDPEKWPDIFKNRLYDPELNWPQASICSYIKDVTVQPELSPYLYFGYVFLEGRVFRSAFFVKEDEVGSDEQTQDKIIPQATVIDPLCLLRGQKPDYYIGCQIDEEYIESFQVYQKSGLELFVERTKTNKRLLNPPFVNIQKIYKTEFEKKSAYWPPQLIRFAQENQLPIPRQESWEANIVLRGDEVVPSLC